MVYICTQVHMRWSCQELIYSTVVDSWYEPRLPWTHSSPHLLGATESLISLIHVPYYDVQMKFSLCLESVAASKLQCDDGIDKSCCSIC